MGRKLDAAADGLVVNDMVASLIRRHTSLERAWLDDMILAFRMSDENRFPTALAQAAPCAQAKRDTTGSAAAPAIAGLMSALPPNVLQTKWSLVKEYLETESGDLLRRPP
jgi:hypothetical protein